MSTTQQALTEYLDERCLNDAQRAAILQGMVIGMLEKQSVVNKYRDEFARRKFAGLFFPDESRATVMGDDYE